MTSDRCEFLNQEAKQYLDDLSDKISKNQVVLFAGGGLSRNAYRKDGKLGAKFPLWGDLTEKMLIKLYGENDKRIKKEKYDYLNVTDKFDAEFGRISLYQLLEEALEDSEFEPGLIHQLISRFNWEIITTNFDTLIERGYELTNKTPNLIITDPDLSNKEKPRIFKINGCIKHARSQIIITSEDFRTFAERKPLIELYVKKCFIESTILFVGFSMTDPAFKMIHGWVRDHLLKSSENRFAYSIQSHVDEPTKKIWIPKGIRFIELFPDGSKDDRVKVKRLYSLFYELYNRQISNKKREEDPDKKEQKTASTLLKNFEKGLSQFEREVKSYEGKSKSHDKIIQDRLRNQLLECLRVFLEGLCSQLDKDNNKTGKLNKEDEEKEFILWEKFLDLTQKYLCKNQEENILFHFFKEMIAKLGEPDSKLSALEKVPAFIHNTIERFFMKNEIEINNPNIWIMAMYMALRIGVFRKLLPVDFFKKGFKIIRQTALKGDSEHEVSKDFHRYWLFSLMFIGPFKCAETLLDICGKKLPQHYPWDIQEYIHYHLEVFFGDRGQKRDLFLRALNSFRTTNEAEAFHKFLLLDTFFEEEELDFNDLFLSHTYRELSGQFRSRMYHFRNTLSSIGFPIKKGYFRDVMQTVFDAVDKGKSFMFTGLSDIILSFPKVTIEDRDIKELKKSSLAELFLLAVFYDKPGKGRKKERELKNLITTMIDSGVIDVSYFLRLLLSRLDEANLINMVQDVDNGLSRYLNGLVTFILCALPYLEKEDLHEIKKTIEFCFPQVKIVKIRQTMIQIIAYIYRQLPGEDFTNILKNIFFLATTAHYASFGLKYLKLSQDELGKDKEIIKYSQRRLLMDRSLEEQGTPFDRDFVAFMLNHDREELFPEEDKRLKEILRTYFDLRAEDTEHLSLQWLMDLQKFIDKGFIQLEPDTEMEARVRKFIDTASEPPEDLREWKLKIFDGKMIKVYRAFAHLFKDQVISKIIESYRKDMRGAEVKDIDINDLDPEVQDNFAHLLKEIYKSEHHKSLKPTIVQNIKEFVKEGLSGGGYPGAFWEDLDKKEKSRLTTIMLELWLPASEESILKAVKATGEFLKYKTDDEGMKELTNRLLYCIFSGSTPVKIQWCSVVAAHVIENNPWYTENKKKILDCLNLFKKETNLELLREFLELVRLFTIEEVKEPTDYLKENAPYAEIRRAAGRFASVSSK